LMGIADYVPSGYCGNKKHAFLTLLMIIQPQKCTKSGTNLLKPL
jgi:hypothetical protein